MAAKKGRQNATLFKHFILFRAEFELPTCFNFFLCQHSRGVKVMDRDRTTHSLIHSHFIKAVIIHSKLQLCCNKRFTHAFTAFSCVFGVEIVKRSSIIAKH